MDYKKEVAKILDNQIKDFDKQINLKNNELLKIKEELKELKKEQRKIVKDKNKMLGITPTKTKKTEVKKELKIEKDNSILNHENEATLKITQVHQVLKNNNINVEKFEKQYSTKMNSYNKNNLVADIKNFKLNNR